MRDDLICFINCKHEELYVRRDGIKIENETKKEKQFLDGINPISYFCTMYVPCANIFLTSSFMYVQCCSCGINYAAVL